MKSLHRFFYGSEIGTLEITGTEDGIVSLDFKATDGDRPPVALAGQDKGTPGKAIPVKAVGGQVVDTGTVGDVVDTGSVGQVVDTGTVGDVVDTGSAGDVPDCLKECVGQLDEYFAGSRKKFDLNLIPEGTVFQKKVWNALLAIPYGKTSSYGEIAEATAGRNAARAVGSANHRNRIAIIIPCHRVVGSNGKLTGYAGGLWRKEWLLAHEKKFL